MHPSSLRLVRIGLLAFVCLLGGLLRAAPLSFSIPSQALSEALLQFSQQTRIEVLFSFDELSDKRSTAVEGSFEPEAALARLLEGTGYRARRNIRGKYVIAREPVRRSDIAGRLLVEGGDPVVDAKVSLIGARRTTRTSADGSFRFSQIAPGTYRIVAEQSGLRTLQLEDVRVTSGPLVEIPTQRMRPATDATRLEPYIVEASADTRVFDPSDTSPTPQSATGNLDLRRSIDDALPFTIIDRTRIARSGAVDLNQVLQREILEADATVSAPPDSGQSGQNFAVGTTNLSLRGYRTDETIILLNGRRLPESVSAGEGTVNQQMPDVNFIPLSLVDRVEILPASASALYAGSAVGGIINIVLRPDAHANATEVSTTYTNALDSYDAPQSSASLLHVRTLLNGALRMRFSASMAQSTSPTEQELGYQARNAPRLSLNDRIPFGATPNVRSADGTPLFAGSAATVTSVPPGATGTEGLAAFAGREGLINTAPFDSPLGRVVVLGSPDYPYAATRERRSLFGSVVYDVSSWLQVGIDATHSRTTINRGLNAYQGDLVLRADNPRNPFRQEVRVSLIETPVELGEEYNEARIGFTSAVAGAVVKLPDDWRLNLDAQLSRNVIEYRGVSSVDLGRWQGLVDEGRYLPLRDTQRAGPPADFYNEALLFTGARNRFVELGNYRTWDTALRLSQRELHLPTGRGIFNIGGDYRRVELGSYTEEFRLGNGEIAIPPTTWRGRRLERLSAFTELQAPLLPRSWLPRGIRNFEVDLAVRHIVADTAEETNTAPTFGFRVDLPAGFSTRGSITTSNRFPTPQLSRPIANSNSGGSGPSEQIRITDPRRNESYVVQSTEAVNPGFRPESTVTQTVGVLYRTGDLHRWRVSLDFFDTHKTDEEIFVSGQTVLDYESYWPERVQREALAPGDPNPVGRVTSLTGGRINALSRRSQNWTLSLDYAWSECFGGTFEAYTRSFIYEKYDREISPGETVDELETPSGVTSSLARYRTNFGAGWSSRSYGFGLDGRYLHSRPILLSERTAQGPNEIGSFWQVDVYLQKNLNRWFPWIGRQHDLRAQLRVNNVLDREFPTYVAHPSGAGVEPYGDWRRRTYSLSLTATF